MNAYDARRDRVSQILKWTNEGRIHAMIQDHGELGQYIIVELCSSGIIIKEEAVPPIFPTESLIAQIHLAIRSGEAEPPKVTHG